MRLQGNFGINGVATAKRTGMIAPIGSISFIN